LYAQFVHDTFREGDLLHGISFVVVETTVHSHNILSAEFAENQFAGMALHRTDGEVRDVRVREFITVSYL
jgi:hypothetical protein